MPVEPFISSWVLNDAFYVVTGTGAIWRYRKNDWMIVGNVDLST